MKIHTINNKKEEEKLRRPVAKFDFSKHSKKEIRELIVKMRKIMKEADGVGLSANQIGLDIKVFVARFENKFYAVFNPKITKESSEKVELEEGCLSVPGAFGEVARADKITLEGFDMNGKKLKIKAWGFLAQIFQHEVDHLEGILFTDKYKKGHKIVKHSSS